MKLAALISGVLIIAGCDPTRFSVISDRNIDCRIYSDHRLVHPSAAGFRLDPDGCVAVSYLWATQHYATFRLTLDSGTGINIMLRPIVEEQILDSGIVLSLSRKGYNLYRRDTLLASAASPALQQGRSYIFRTFSDEGYLELTLDCDTLYRGITRRIEGDDIIFATMPGSVVSVVAPVWRDIELLPGERPLTVTK